MRINMQDDTLTPLITRFTNLIDALIKDFKDFNLDEETVIMLANKTRNFINFTELALLNVIFNILEKMGEYKFINDDQIKDITKMVETIFEKMNQSLDTILEHEDEEEEHVHDHDHNHEHHFHIDIDAVQKDIDKIVEYLVFLRRLIVDVGQMAIALLKYQKKEISEDEFKNEYNLFKENMNSYKEEFENNLI